MFPKAISVQALCPNRRPPSEATFHTPLSLSREDPPPLPTLDPYQRLHQDETVCAGYWCVCVFSGDRLEGCWGSHSWRQMSVLPLSTNRLFTLSNTNTLMLHSSCNSKYRRTLSVCNMTGSVQYRLIGHAFTSPCHDIPKELEHLPLSESKSGTNK